MSSPIKFIQLSTDSEGSLLGLTSLGEVYVYYWDGTHSPGWARLAMRDITEDIAVAKAAAAGATS